MHGRTGYPHLPRSRARPVRQTPTWSGPSRGSSGRHQLLVSGIEARRARLRALNKPLLAILVTHQHPDHLNGVFGLVQDKEAPV